jgi:hypothetical protein
MVHALWQTHSTERNPQMTHSLKDKLEAIFTYHDNPDLIPHYEAIREKAREFAVVILDNTPECADQSAAIRLVREAVMTANASIALGGLV